MIQSKDSWLSQSWGELRLDPNQKLPNEWGHGSHIRLSFLCKCGRSTKHIMNDVGRCTTCGKCSFKSKSHWLTQEWGGIKLGPEQRLPDEWGLRSGMKFSFVCHCKRNFLSRMCNVTNGNTTSCGKCSFLPKSYWAAQKWGSLTLDKGQPLPDEWSPNSTKKFVFVCDCGTPVSLRMNSVTTVNSVSCGKCKYKSREHWLTQKWGKLTLSPNQELPEEWGPGLEKNFVFVCDCGQTTAPSMSDVSRHDDKGTLSCGCINPGKSRFSAAYEVFDFVKTIASDAEFSYWFETPDGERREYDIYVPSKKLAIEYHGLHWHSEKFEGRKRDRDKFLLSGKKGVRLIQIYSDEWRCKREIVKAHIEEILAPRNGARVRPVFEMLRTTPSSVRKFLDRHHYLGAAGGCLTILARHPKSKEIIGVWVFMKREAGTVLWHRACWDHRYKAWNPHEKALKTAMPILREMGFEKILTFSDNRFHTGEMYEKIGFKFEKELKPDYSYTDGKHRISKYALRVKSGINEEKNARDLGWYRIWDSGKKRFSLPL